MIRFRNISLIACCLLALQCTGRQEEGVPQPIQFHLEDVVTHLTKGDVVMEPTALFPEGEQVDTLWIAAISEDMTPGSNKTKGVPFNATEGFPQNLDLGLVAYQYAIEDADSTSWTLFTAVNDSRLVRYYPDTGRWIPTPGLYYPSGDGYARFFVFGPRDGSVTGVVAADHSGPVLSYTVPSAIADQRGLMVASPEQRHFPSGLAYLSVPLSLNHALSGVSFAIDNSYKLVSITVSGVYDQGVYYIASERWGGRGKSIVAASGPSYFIGPFDYTDPSYYGSDMERATAILDRLTSKYTLMMIPQHVPEGATVTVQIAGEARPRVLDISGQLWEKGKLVTYLIAYDRISLLGMPTEDLIEEDGSY